MVEFIKTCDQYSGKFTFGHFFSSIVLPPFCWGKKKAVLRNGQFPSAWGVMIRTLGRVLLGDMSKNEKIHFFDSQMYFPAILTS